MMQNDAVPLQILAEKNMETSKSAPNVSWNIDPTVWVDEHGDCLFRFALLRLRDETLAEDMVQETLLAAFQSLKSYGGKSSERTWLIGILKHKIIDYYRKNNKLTQPDEEDLDLTGVNKFFERDDEWNGHWQVKLRPVEITETPEQVLERAEFWEVMHDCMTALPTRVASVFTLREMDGLTSEEICETLNLSASNFWVIMHRARMQLRRCVELKWFRRAN